MITISGSTIQSFQIEAAHMPLGKLKEKLDDVNLSLEFIKAQPMGWKDPFFKELYLEEKDVLESELARRES